MSRIERFVLLALAAAACAGCSGGDVKVRNQSQSPVRAVVINVGGNTLRIDALKAGAEASVSYVPKADSSISVAFQFGKRSIDTIVLGGLLRNGPVARELLGNG